MATTTEAAKSAKAGADKSEPDQAAEQKSARHPSKKKRIIVYALIILLVLALAGGAAWFFLGHKKAPLEGEDPAVDAPPTHATTKGPPTFFPLDNMVVNLADPGGEKVAQVGITLEMADAKDVAQIKTYLPQIRSNVLLLISQRTSQDVLTIEGKQKLAADILQETLRPFDESDPQAAAHKGAKPAKVKIVKNASGQNPVVAVHFSSFIVQ